MSRTFRNKTAAVFLAATVGGVGLHRFYLEGKDSRAALAFLGSFSLLAGCGLAYAISHNPAFGLNLPYDLFTPAVLLAALPVIAAFLDAIYIGLMADARFDLKFNAGCPRANHSGAVAVTLVVLSLAVGSTLMTTVLAVDLEALVGVFSHHTLDE